PRRSRQNSVHMQLYRHHRTARPYCSVTNHPTSTKRYTLSLHDALPIYELPRIGDGRVKASARGGHGDPLGDGQDRLRGGGAALEEASSALRHQDSGDLVGPHDAAPSEGGGEARLDVGDAIALERAEAG